VYVPEAKIWHKNPIKDKMTDKTPNTGRSSGLPYYYRARNNFNFMRKNANRWQYCSFLIYFFGWYLWFMTGVCLIYHRDIGKLVGFYRGLRDGLLKSEAGARFYTGY